jgi:hypothetical protein
MAAAAAAAVAVWHCLQALLSLIVMSDGTDTA